MSDDSPEPYLLNPINTYSNMIIFHFPWLYEIPRGYDLAMSPGRDGHDGHEARLWHYSQRGREKEIKAAGI